MRDISCKVKNYNYYLFITFKKYWLKYNIMKYENFNSLVLKRQSDRSYLPEPVSESDILKCIEAARLAPSACNSQPWRFVVVNDRNLLSEMSSAASGSGMNKFVSQAPVVVAVVLEKMNITARIGSMLKNKDYSMLDIGMAVEHFCLQAAELGLGTCILGWFDEKKVAHILGVPKGKRIPLLIVMGHPAGENRKKVRKSMEEISSWNRY